MLDILFIGSPGEQSLITLKGIIDSGHSVCAVAVAGSSLGMGSAASSRRVFIPAINADSGDSILTIAMERGIPVEIIYPGAIQNQLQSYSPDIGITSCFPHRLQNELLRLPKFGCVNLHPSLLPKYPGPAPLFWQLWHGETHTGVTLHQMESRLDAGNIISQERLPIRDGVSEAELSRLCATRGSALVRNALRQIELGTLVSTPQNRQHISYHGWPTAQDFHITTDWSTRRISNFINGTRQRGKKYHLGIGQTLFLLDSVMETSPNPIPIKDYIVEGRYLRFNCYDGCVTARLAK